MTTITSSPIDQFREALRRISPPGFAAYGFQEVGVAFALSQGRALIGDEQGVGKTIQALLAAKAAGSRRILVICKATLKANWQAEVTRWLPEYRSQVISGTTPYDTRSASVIIANYDILGGKLAQSVTPRGRKISRYDAGDGWAAVLSEGGFDALIVDESHALKNPVARRTQAVAYLARAIPAEGLVLLLTGTAIVNRPIELLSQLEILGRTEAVVRAAQLLGAEVPPVALRKVPSAQFRYLFAWNPSNRWDQWGGHPNADILNRALRATCYLRRQREDVLGLLPTRQILVPLSLNGALGDYREAEANFYRWLRDHYEDGADRVARAAKAEVITRLNLLRKLAERAKIEATVEWVTDWLDQNETGRLVVFAEHREVQQALVSHFHCPSILAGERDPLGQAATWERGNVRVIVCSLGAAKEGHNLQAASQVVFTGFGWTPGGLSQAEARVNRAGQKASETLAWQLVAPETVEADILALIQAKREVSNAVLIGDEDEDEGSAVGAAIAGVLSRAH